MSATLLAQAQLSRKPKQTGPRAVGPRAMLPLLRAARLDWGEIRPFLDADTPELLREIELAR